MAAWTCETTLTTKAVAECARAGVLTKFNTLRRLKVKQMLEWGQVNTGVFDTFKEQPTWSARAHIPGDERFNFGEANCEIYVYDLGESRRVELVLTKSTAGAGMVRKMADGISATIRSADPGLKEI